MHHPCLQRRKLKLKGSGKLVSAELRFLHLDPEHFLPYLEVNTGRPPGPWDPFPEFGSPVIKDERESANCTETKGHVRSKAEFTPRTVNAEGQGAQGRG